MARIHKGLVGVGALVVAGAMLGSWGIAKGTGFAWSSIFGKEEVALPQSEPGFEVEYGPDPKEPKEDKPAPERKTLTEKVAERRERDTRTQVSRAEPRKKQTLTEKWLENVNSNGMYTFGEDTGVTMGTYDPDGECTIQQPVRVRAMMADNATTDQPGTAFGAVTEDIQGISSSGDWCVAIPEASVVSFQVSQAGEYATNRAPVQVLKIWLPDGFEVPVDQTAKHIDGIPGVVGKANHHVVSKTIAGGAGLLFRFIDNISRIGQYNVRSGDVTDPFEKAIDRSLNRPAEITLTSQVVEFDLMPTSTPGY